jgi:hypothetical protein
MAQQKTAENSISYFTPTHGKVETPQRIPESYRLHVCPSACGRRFGIRALNTGEKDHVSFLAITEADIVSGHYEDIISEAIGELLAELTQKPKVFFIYFNCIDDFLATDEQALVQRLTNRYPFLRFAVCHVDPIAMDEILKPNMKMTNQMFNLLDYTGKKDDGVNLISNFAAIDAESEFFRVLSGWGINHVRQILNSKTFAGFMQMADSKLNLVMSVVGRYAAQNMAKKLDISYLMIMTYYEIDDIVKAYSGIADMLGKKIPDFKQEIEQTRQVIAKTQAHIGNIPIIVDSVATCLPFGMAKALCRYGFNVQAVFFIRMNDGDVENRQWLGNHFPQVSIVRSQDYKFVMDAGYKRDCIAIGFDSAFTLHANHFVDMRRDESFYGFQGVRKLMRLICEAYDTTADWERIKEMDKETKRL